MYDAEATKYDCASVSSLIVFINGINAPFTQVIKPKIKNNPAIIHIAILFDDFGFMVNYILTYI